jgi:hypothetical protein
MLGFWCGQAEKGPPRPSSDDRHASTEYKLSMVRRSDLISEQYPSTAHRTSLVCSHHCKPEMVKCPEERHTCPNAFALAALPGAPQGAGQ